MRYTLIVLFLLNSLNWSQVYMNIKNKDGTTKSFNIDEVRKLTFSGVVDVEESDKLASAINSFVLMQNFPNPFNPSTTIKYQIPKAGNVVVSVYSITGQLVKTIEKDFKNTGIYEVHWNSKNDFGQKVASGIYLMRVKFNNSYLTKKIILLK